VTIAKYTNKYPGSHWTIVGKGRTRFEYANLSRAPGPVIFINDAVRLESHLAGQPSFFFAHDTCQAIWLDRIQSIPVLPASGAVDSAGVPLISAGLRRGVVKYRWDEKWRRAPANVIDYTREDLGQLGSLFIGCGTIHTAIHFAWLAGAEQISFIGCDGKNNSNNAETAYDPRVAVDSGGLPRGCFSKIRALQDWLLKKLDIDATYVAEKDYGYLIPAIAHFVWLGDAAPLPDWVKANIGAFADMHPGWDIHIWRDLPRDLPPSLNPALSRTTMLCQQADITRYWRLWQFGGMYFDCDMLFLRSCDNLRKAAKLWAAPQPTDKRINNAAMGACTQNFNLRKLLYALPQASLCHKRAKYGPNLLTQHSELITVLPAHYFYPAACQAEAHMIWRGEKSLADMTDRFEDGEPPYMVHLWGVNGSGQTPIPDAAQVAAETQRAHEVSS